MSFEIMSIFSLIEYQQTKSILKVSFYFTILFSFFKYNFVIKKIININNRKYLIIHKF